jgi:glycosyltransferase involved in cell wall biosynthesis
MSKPAKLLVVCHASAAETAVAAARRLWRTPTVPAIGADRDTDGGLIDVLCYGRASDDRPAPAGSVLVAPAAPESTSLRQGLALLLSLRRRRYEMVALSQPALGLNRARGILVAYAYLVSYRSAVILDVDSALVARSINLALVLRELVRWLALNVLAAIAARVVSGMLGRLSRGSAASVEIASGGSVAYLRTDIELSITPLERGGSVSHTEGILQALVDKGYDVSYWGTGSLAGIPEQTKDVRLKSFLKGNLPIEIAELISGLLQGVSTTRPPADAPTAFVYQRYSLNNLAGVILARRRKLPLILEANASEAKWRRDFGTLKFPDLAFACERLILRQASLVAAVSQNAAEDLVASGADPARLRVVPNGVNLRRFADAQPMPLPNGFADGFTVCFVGLFYPWHGVRFLAEAFGVFHQRRPDARLVLVGDGEELPSVRAVLERHGALEATHFAGLVPRPEAPRFMAAADVLVSPHADVRRFIGSPIKLFEYMASGKAIVATRVGQIPDILADERSALLVAPEEPEAMAAALERLYADRDLRQRLGAEAQRQAGEDHSWDARLALILDGTGDEPDRAR